MKSKFARNLSAFVITGALAVPLTVGVYAAGRPQTDHQQKEADEKAEKADKAVKKSRVYDAKHNDYHDWDANEDRAYRRYRSEKHENYDEFGNLTSTQQSEYWEWRHDNPDTH